MDACLGEGEVVMSFLGTSERPRLCGLRLESGLPTI